MDLRSKAVLCYYEDDDDVDDVDGADEDKYEDDEIFMMNQGRGKQAGASSDVCILY